jgi:ABC-2 type transport system permease protein
MLGSLVKINLQNLFFANYASKNTNGKKRSPFAVVGLILLFIYLFAVLAFAMGTMFMSLYEPYHALQLDWFYFGFAGIMSFGICFIFSIFATKTQLFEAGDNEFLLSMPIKPLTILTSRVLSLLLMNYLYSAIVMVPALVVYLIMGQLSVMGIVSFVLVFVTLPLFSLALSCLFGWLLALATSKMRNKNIFTMILSSRSWVRTSISTPTSPPISGNLRRAARPSREPCRRAPSPSTTWATP